MKTAEERKNAKMSRSPRKDEEDYNKEERREEGG